MSSLTHGPGLVHFNSLPMVFTRDRDKVIFRSVELYDLVNSTYDSVVYDQVKTGSSESQAEAEELNQPQSVAMYSVIGLSSWDYPSASDSDNLVFTIRGM